MNNQNLIQLIRESIQNYISEIDSAGENAACEAKISAIGEAITTREKKMNMEGIDEAYHDMIDKSKMKELASEIKTLKKSLTKYQKQLEKLKSKGGKSEKVEDTEKKEIVDEVSLPEDKMDNEYENMGMEEDMNIYEVLHMQKLAGIITEEQYNEAVATNYTPPEKPQDPNYSTVGGIRVANNDSNVDAIIKAFQTRVSNVKNIDSVPELVKMFDALLMYIKDVTKGGASSSEMISTLNALSRKYKSIDKI
jgi:hypothetical protein